MNIRRLVARIVNIGNPKRWIIMINIGKNYMFADIGEDGTKRQVHAQGQMISVRKERKKMIEMPITLEPYESYCNRLIEETHKMVKEMHDIVHCKDCKYCEDESYTDEDTGKEVKYLVCDRWYEQDDADGNMFPKADDFCSRGERKDG